MKTSNLFGLLYNLLNFENLLKLAVDKFCEKLPSFMSNRTLVWIEICLAVGTPLAKQQQ